MKGPYAEIRNNEHLLPEGREAETEYTSVIRARDMHGRKCQKHRGKCINAASHGVPEKILFYCTLLCRHLLRFSKLLLDYSSGKLLRISRSGNYPAKTAIQAKIPACR